MNNEKQNSKEHAAGDVDRAPARWPDNNSADWQASAPHVVPSVNSTKSTNRRSGADAEGP